MNVYVFVRKSRRIHLIECTSDAAARAQAETNRETVRVEDLNGRAVWAA